MKLRTRLTAMTLTILLAAQLPFSAFADTAGAAPDMAGQVVVINEDGTQQVLTAEDLAGGTGLPGNITVQGAASTPAADSAPQSGASAPESERIDLDLPLPETTQEGDGQRINADLPVVVATSVWMRRCL